MPTLRLHSLIRYLTGWWNGIMEEGATCMKRCVRWIVNFERTWMLPFTSITYKFRNRLIWNRLEVIRFRLPRTLILFLFIHNSSVKKRIEWFFFFKISKLHNITDYLLIVRYVYFMVRLLNEWNKALGNLMQETINSEKKSLHLKNIKESIMLLYMITWICHNSSMFVTELSGSR